MSVNPTDLQGGSSSSGRVKGETPEVNFELLNFSGNDEKASSAQGNAQFHPHVDNSIIIEDDFVDDSGWFASLSNEVTNRDIMTKLNSLIELINTQDARIAAIESRVSIGTPLLKIEDTLVKIRHDMPDYITAFRKHVIDLHQGLKSFTDSLDYRVKRLEQVINAANEQV